MAKTGTDIKLEERADDLWGSASGRGQTLQISVKQELDLPDLMARQTNKLRMKTYKGIGQLKRMLFEQAGNEAVKSPDNPLVGNKKNFLHLDWMAVGPLIGTDGEDLLVCGSLPEPPQIVDPDWKPEPVLDHDMVMALHNTGQSFAQIAVNMGTSVERVNQAASMNKGESLWPDPPKVKQSVWDRSYGPLKIGPEVWECFQPIYLLELFSKADGGFHYVKAATDGDGNPIPDNKGRHMAMLWHEPTKRAHFVYGMWEVKLTSPGTNGPY